MDLKQVIPARFSRAEPCAGCAGFHKVLCGAVRAEPSGSRDRFTAAQAHRYSRSCGMRARQRRDCLANRKVPQLGRTSSVSKLEPDPRDCRESREVGQHDRSEPPRKLIRCVGTPTEVVNFVPTAWEASWIIKPSSSLSVVQSSPFSCLSASSACGSLLHFSNRS